MKRRTHATNAAPSGATVLPVDGSNAKLSTQDVPRSIVAKCSKVDVATAELIQDLRRLMGPYTATNLKEKRSNRMKDYTSVAGSLGVSRRVSNTDEHGDAYSEDRHGSYSSLQSERDKVCE